MDEQAQSLNDDLYGWRSVKTEGLVAHDAHLGLVLHEVVGYERNEMVGAHQNGNRSGGNAQLDELAHLLHQLVQHAHLIIVVG